MNPDDPDHTAAAGGGDALAAAALEWFVSRRDGAWPARREREFALWLAADPAHGQAYAGIEQLWLALDAVPAPASVPVPPSALSAPSAMLERGRPAGAWRAWYGGAIAACAALLMALQGQDMWIAATADARTGPGELRELTLADGTRVSLDAHSAIDVAFTPDGRRIRLRQGRAWFDVAPEARPFTVALGEARITDIGTAFEVTKRRQGGEVAVSEGIVEIAAPGRPALRLHEGEAARFDNSGESRVVEAPPGPGSWRQGRLQFVNVALADLLDDLARHDGAHPVFLDRWIGARRITGMIDLADPARARHDPRARGGQRRAHRLLAADPQPVTLSSPAVDKARA
jgi:transmembrane sensor